ncbi:MAG: hypothetical protein M3O46_18890 [Myxococcota bacterium]|nr:hypothetical protein [Myxococcota bacterium]
MTRSGRLARDAVALVSMLVLVSPIWLGPAMSFVSREMARPQHLCACGMAMGKCGCPTCARIAQQGDRETGSKRCPAVKMTCDDENASLSSSSPLMCDLPREIGIVASVTNELMSPPMLAHRLSLDAERPPIPPPRHYVL